MKSGIVLGLVLVMFSNMGCGTGSEGSTPAVVQSGPKKVSIDPRTMQVQLLRLNGLSSADFVSGLFEVVQPFASSVDQRWVDYLDTHNQMSCHEKCSIELKAGAK